MDQFSILLVCLIWIPPGGFHQTAGWTVKDDVVSQKLSGPEGSTFHLAEPKLCNVSEKKNYELHIGKDLIGFHHDGFGKSRLQYTNRLIFIQENCTFVLKDMTQEDTHVYTLLTHYEENGKPVTHQTIFNITITGNAFLPAPQEHPGNIIDSGKNPQERTHFAVFVVALGVIVILAY